MAETVNKAAIRRLYAEVFTLGQLAVADELLAAEYVGYDPPNSPRAMRGSASMKQGAERSATAFPDRRYTLEALLEDEDMVAVRVMLEGTHTGQFFDTLPTGRQVAVAGTIIYHLVEGKIVASWGNWDNLGLMRQLGLLSQ